MDEPLTLVTGASSDIGREVVRRLARRGGRIVAHCHRGEEKLRDLVAASPGPAEIVPFAADLRDPARLQSLVDGVGERFGVPERIVHLAGLPLELRRFSQFDWDAVEADLEVQVKSLALIARAFLPRLAQSGRPGKVVVMLSSVTLSVPPRSMAGYITVKYALLGLTRALAAEYADKRINVNAVSPSTVDTQFLAGVPEKYREITAEQNPTGRNALPSDVAPLVEFLLSPESDYLTGANIPVAGGAVF